MNNYNNEKSSKHKLDLDYSLYEGFKYDKEIGISALNENVQLNDKCAQMLADIVERNSNYITNLEEKFTFNNGNDTCEAQNVPKEVSLSDDTGVYHISVKANKDDTEKESSPIALQYLYLHDAEYDPYSSSLGELFKHMNNFLTLENIDNKQNLFRLPREPITVQQIANDAIISRPKMLIDTIERITGEILKAGKESSGIVPEEMKLNQIVVSRENGEIKILPSVRLKKVPMEKITESAEKIEDSLKSQISGLGKTFMQINTSYNIFPEKEDIDNTTEE